MHKASHFNANIAPAHESLAQCFAPVTQELQAPALTRTQIPANDVISNTAEGITIGIYTCRSVLSPRKALAANSGVPIEQIEALLATESEFDVLAQIHGSPERGNMSIFSERKIGTGKVDVMVIGDEQPDVLSCQHLSSDIDEQEVGDKYRVVSAKTSSPNTQ